MTMRPHTPPVSQNACPGISREVSELGAALQAHLEVCQELLALSQKETELLKSPEPFRAEEIQAQRKALSTRLEAALKQLTKARGLHGASGNSLLSGDPALSRLHQATMDAVMRLLVLDRENEQHLLRRGLLPRKALPPAAQSQPHFVASLYQQHSA
jgi:hypothetical protein